MPLVKVGIFTSWDLNLLDKPEDVLHRQLEDNSTYPFIQVEPNVYMLNVKSPHFRLMVLMSLMVAVLTISIYAGYGEVDEYIVFPLLALIGCIKQGVAYAQDRTYVLDGNAKMYEFYCGNTLFYRGHFHNIYIRVSGQKAGGTEVYYKLTLNGHEIDENSITTTTTNYKKLVKFGHRIAYRLNINFFDATDICRKHAIRHRCPYNIQSDSSLDSTDYSSQSYDV